MKFTHLHVHSEYSLLDGLSKIPDLISRAKELGMDSLALTDHGVMYGAIKFYTTAKDAGINPIIGVESYIAKRTRFDKQPGVDADQFHQLLLAKNYTGYRNLMKLVSLGHLEGYYYKPRIDKELLTRYHDGIIATSGCLQSEIPQSILEGNLKEAQNTVRFYVNLFGEDFYLELQRHKNIAELDVINQQLIKFSREFGIPLVATNDVHYVREDDAEAQDALLAVQTKKFLSDRNRLSMISSPDFFLKSTEEMATLFRDVPEAIENSQKIANSCDIDIPIGKWILPHYPLSPNQTPETALRALTDEGLQKRFSRISKDVQERAEYELGVICRKGFATYFLIVQDFVNWAKNNGIRVGPGRGSVAGSLVAYALRITSINPLEHNIPFERFMNPDRPTPPDIDMDFADDRRDEVIEYVTKRYGKDRVAQIITFGTMEARQAIRDIGRVMGLSYSVPDKIAKLIPFGYSLKDALQSSFDLQVEAKDPAVEKLLALAERVEGVTRHASTHAAGVVIADRDLVEYTPIQKETNSDRIVTQYDMYSLDLNISDKAVGLLKIDFLGLRNLTILGKAVEFVKQKRGIDVDLSEIPLDNQKVYQMLSSGETTGVFQLESRGMRRLAKHLKPTKFSDITAMVALFRPGPMELIDEFVKGKHHPQEVSYLHPDLKPILEPTYGVAVYQEQCMQIAHKVAGYTMAEADNLRRAIGKKKKSMMEKEKKKFISGAQKNGYSNQIADKIWGFIERFVGYGFNIPHSVSYAMIAYQTAYMKVLYPVEYMTAVLTAESRSTSGPAGDQKVALAIEECRRLGIQVLPPDINVSNEDFSLEKERASLDGEAIRFGLSAIKNVGTAAMMSILEARKNKGPFHSLIDLLERVDTQKVNRKVLESLIKVGSTGTFGTRSSQLAMLDDARATVNAKQRKVSQGQTSLFETMTGASSSKEQPSVIELAEFSHEELLQFERDLLGIYLTEHPLQRFVEPIKALITEHIGHLLPEESVGSDVVIAGMVTHVRQVQTKRSGQLMCFATIEDETGSVDLVVFPTIYERFQSDINRDTPILVSGKVDFRQERLSIVVNNILNLSQAIDHSKLMSFKRNGSDMQSVTIPRGTSREVLSKLARVLKSHPGSDRIRIVLPTSNGAIKTMDLPYTVDWRSVESEALSLIKSSSAPG